MQAASAPTVAVPSQLIPINPSQLLQLFNANQVPQNAVPVIVIAPSANGLSLPQQLPIQAPDVVSAAAAAAAAELSTMRRFMQTPSQPSALPSETMTELEEMQRNFPRRYGALLTLASAQIITQLSAELTNLISSVSSAITSDENADFGSSMPAINEHLIGITNVNNMLSISINSLNEMSKHASSPRATTPTQLEQVELKCEEIRTENIKSTSPPAIGVGDDPPFQETTEPSRGSWNRSANLKAGNLFVCSKMGCKRRFRRLQNLQAHLRKTHMGSGKTSSKGRGNVMLQHQCPVPGCEKSYSRRRKLNIHMTTHTGVEWFCCSECTNRFITQEDLEEHVKAHRTKKAGKNKVERKKKYGCTHEGCEKAFTKPSKLVEHQRCHTGEKPFVCTHPGCGAAFARSYSLSNHQQRHSKLEKSSTEAISMKLEESSVSTAAVSQTSPSSTINLTLETDFKESQSSKVSPSSTPSIDNGAGNASNSSGSKFAVGAPSASALAETAIVVRGALGACRYICPIAGCKRICPKFYKLREHLCRHTNERPIVCPECGATFVRPYDLTRHTSTHHNHKKTGDSSPPDPASEA